MGVLGTRDVRRLPLLGQGGGHVVARRHPLHPTLGPPPLRRARLLGRQDARQDPKGRPQLRPGRVGRRLDASHGPDPLAAPARAGRPARRRRAAAPPVDPGHGRERRADARLGGQPAGVPARQAQAAHRARRLDASAGEHPQAPLRPHQVAARGRAQQRPRRRRRLRRRRRRDAAVGAGPVHQRAHAGAHGRDERGRPGHHEDGRERPSRRCLPCLRPGGQGVRAHAPGPLDSPPLPCLATASAPLEPCERPPPHAGTCTRPSSRR